MGFKMLEKDILLVINPLASKGRGKDKAKSLGSYLEKHNRVFVIEYTRAKGHAEKIALDGARNGYKVIVAVGGDGTVNEVLNGIMRSGFSSSVKMGIIPVGRGNDFAWVCNIPKDMYKAVDLILKDNGKKTDVGLCCGDGHPDGMYFFNGAGFGFEPMVNFKAMEYKHLNGMPSYIMAFLFILRHPPKGFDLELTIDGEKRKLSTQQLSVANGIRMGSAFKMTPRALIDDGKFDVMFTNKIFTGVDLIALVFKFLKGDHVKDKVNFTYLKATEVEIDAKEANIPAHLDGEVFSKNLKRAKLNILPGAINLIR